MMHDASAASRARISDFRRRRPRLSSGGGGVIYMVILGFWNSSSRLSVWGPEQLGTEKVLLALFFLITISFGKWQILIRNYEEDTLWRPKRCNAGVSAVDPLAFYSGVMRMYLHNWAYITCAILHPDFLHLILGSKMSYKLLMVFKKSFNGSIIFYCVI